MLITTRSCEEQKNPQNHWGILRYLGWLGRDDLLYFCGGDYVPDQIIAAMTGSDYIRLHLRVKDPKIGVKMKEVVR